MVDYQQEFEASFARLTEPGRCDPFLDRFYQRFVATDPLVAEKFRTTDMGHQREMLRESLAEMFDFFLKHQSNPHLVTLSRIHGPRGHGVAPRLYDLWLEALIATVRELDPMASDRVELAWRMIMAPGLEFMKFYRER